MNRLWLLIGILVGLSLVVLSSLARPLFLAQILWLAGGLAVLLILRFIDWRVFFNKPWVVWGFYAAGLVLLIITLFDPTIRGTHSWLTIGFFRFQPIELMKVSLILLYAHYFSRSHLTIRQPSVILGSLGLVFMPIALVAWQPDLGSALILLTIWLGFLVMSGLYWRHFFVIAALGAVLGVVVWSNVLRVYQKERILNFFYPERDALTFNYNVIQSKIAIGSAGWWGKGYGQGSQTQLGFLPEASNDFIFAALVEEWGWIGGAVALMTFFFLVHEIVRIGRVADQNFERFVCLGTALTLLSEFYFNVGSAIGLSPVVGIPFPFLSYGGSNLVTSFALVGLVHAIERYS